MTTHLYTVAPKDCLWSLAERFYHQPTLWPLLFAYNNRPEAIEQTGTAILDPDLILIGQQLVIPLQEQLTGDPANIKHKISQQRQDYQRKNTQHHVHLQRIRQSQPTANGEEPMGRSFAKPLAKPAFVVDLGESKIPPIKGQGFSINLSIKGALLIQSTQAVIDGLTVENLNRIKFTSKNEVETAAGKLIQDAKLNFDPKSKKLTLSCGLTTQSNMPNAPEIGLVASVNTNGQPTLKGSATFTLVKGKFQEYMFASEEVTFEVEVIAEEGGQVAPEMQASSASNFNWSDALGIATVVGLTVGAVVIVVGTLAEDVVTAGAGIADDPASFAIAAGMLKASGRLLTTHLPRLSPRLATGLGFTLAAPMTTADNPITAE